MEFASIHCLCFRHIDGHIKNPPHWTLTAAIGSDFVAEQRHFFLLSDLLHTGAANVP